MKAVLLSFLVGVSASAFASDCSLQHPIPVSDLLGHPTVLHHLLVGETPAFLHPENYVAGKDTLSLELFNIDVEGAASGYLGGMISIDGKEDTLGFEKSYLSSAQLGGGVQEGHYGTRFFNGRHVYGKAVRYITVSVKDGMIRAILIQNPIYECAGDHGVFTGKHQQLCVYEADLVAPVTPVTPLPKP